MKGMNMRKVYLMLLQLGFMLNSVAHADCVVGEKKVSPRTGHIFVCDDSDPNFKNAYKDEDGLIWLESPWVAASYRAVKSYCESKGRRLPTKLEFETLAVHLGSRTIGGYSRYESDGKTYLLPFLKSPDLWSSDQDLTYPRLFYYFTPPNGEIRHQPYDFSAGFVCVKK